MPSRFARLAAVLTLAALSVAAHAGPLTPPPGPVAPTHKTLTEIEPRRPISAATTPGDADSIYRITQPGAYYLTGRVAGLPGRHGIEVSASNVTIDLNGFDVVGTPGSLSGIATPVAGLSNIEIRNGSVAFWEVSGVDLATFPARNCRLEALRCSSNGDAIRVGPACTIAECSVTGNTGDGVTTGIIAILIGCKAYLNGGVGFDAGPGSSLDSCTAGQNTGDGFAGRGANTFTACTAYGNGGDGFEVPETGAFVSCMARDNGAAGFSAHVGGALTGCTARGNGSDGIDAQSTCVVVNCVANGNAGNGIRGGAFGIVRSNACVSNGDGGDGAGIHALSSSRVEDNHCVGNGCGIRVSGAGNVIVRNTCNLNTLNYEIAQNNRYGPIIDISASGSPPVSGSEAIGTIGSAHPWANFAQ